MGGKLDVARLRAEAERCRKLARRLPDRGLRNVLEETAHTYERLADEAERLEHGQSRSEDAQ